MGQWISRGGGVGGFTDEGWDTEEGEPLGMGEMFRCVCMDREGGGALWELILRLFYEKISLIKYIQYMSGGYKY